METETFLEHYRIFKEYDGSRIEIGRNGPAIIYKASDLRTGAPVALTLLPISSVDPAQREEFEEKARAATLLDHINVAKTVSFGTVADEFVFVSEYPEGETIQAWIAEHGPMPPDAVLRVALQVVGALIAGSFHGLTHPAIQPSNLMIVPGKTSEGGWPFVKLTNFALAGLKTAAGQPGVDAIASEFASPEQMQQGTVDFRSEIYSLGATMCFLLTGVFYSAEPRSAQTKRFARPLRSLIASTLRDSPDERPHDPVVFTQTLRDCLVKVERRQALQRKLGIPIIPLVARPPKISMARPPEMRLVSETAVVATPPTNAVSNPIKRPRAWLPRTAWAIAALLLALGVVAAFLLPEDVVRTALHKNDAEKTIGVPVGVAEASPAAVAPIVSRAPAVGTNAPIPPPAEPASSIPNQTVANSSPAAASANQDPSLVTQPSLAPNGPTSSTSTQIAANNPAAEPPTPAQGPDDVAAPPAGSAVTPDAPISNPADANIASEDAESHAPSNSKKAENSPNVAASKTRSKTATSASKTTRRSSTASRRTRVSQFGPEDSEPRSSRPGNAFRARFLGTTPDGNLILGLPSGETILVRPRTGEQYSPGEPSHRRMRRILIERRRIVPPPPPPPFMPIFPPDA